MGEKMVVNMALVRVISGLLEIGAAMAIIRLGRIETALRINAFLGLIGPLVFLAVSALGLVAVAVRLIPWKVALLILGLILVLIGTK
ncbi:MAG TPA: DUF2619 domain-containing protein [Bacillota bacterium]|jgi:hypothetical protein|nr:DUF2619 domain-containing protein [Bacillota bacterium]HPT67052.1 DUF2619 domain-containing protein [Bacillota bacterium]